MIATMCEVAFNVIRDGLEVLRDRIVAVFETVFFIKSPSRVYAEMNPIGWYSASALGVTFDDDQKEMIDQIVNALDIQGGHVPLPPDPPKRPIECRYCGRKYPAGTFGSCESCGGLL